MSERKHVFLLLLSTFALKGCRLAFINICQFVGYLAVRNFSVPLFSLQLFFLKHQVPSLEPKYQGHCYLLPVKNT